MKLLFALIFAFAIVNISAQILNFSPTNSPRLAPDWTPIPLSTSSYTAYGTNLDGFLKPGLLQNTYINNNPSVLAFDSASRTYFWNVTNSWYYANSEIACLGSPGYPTWTVYYPNTNHHWTSADEIAGFTTVVQTGKTIGPDLGYTTITLKTMAIPAIGTSVVLTILPDLLYKPGQTVIVVPFNNLDNSFQGKVVSYIRDKLTLTVTLAIGSGTFSEWDVYVSGDLLYTGPSFDTTSCLLPLSNTIITDTQGYIKAWLTWESFNVLGLNYTQYGLEAFDVSVSATYFDKFVPGTPPAHLLQPPPGCVSPGVNFCDGNNMAPPYPAFVPYPNPAYYYETYPN